MSIRKKNLQRMILAAAQQIEMPDGIQVELNKAELYAKEKNAKPAVVALMELVIGLFKKRIFMTIERPEFRLANFRCRIRNIYFNMEPASDAACVLFFGFRDKVVKRKTQVLTYNFQLFDSPMVLPFKYVGAVKMGNIVLTNGTTIRLTEMKEKWK